MHRFSDVHITLFTFTFIFKDISLFKTFTLLTDHRVTFNALFTAGERVKSNNYNIGAERLSDIRSLSLLRNYSFKLVVRSNSHDESLKI